MNKILIIDRGGEHTTATTTFLTESGYEVLVAENVFRAAAILHKVKFDLILCSQHFFFEEQSPLQEIILEDTRHSKIILLREHGEDLPMGDQNKRIIGQIEKPIDQDKLLEVISSQVQRSGFSGMVNDIDITDYLQLLAMNKVTKAIVVEGESGRGVIVLHKGELVYADYGEFRGDLAFHALLSLHNGKITDKKLKRIPKKNINKSLTQLLLESSTNNDEMMPHNAPSRSDFLFEETMGPDSGPQISPPSQPPVTQGSNKSSLFLGMALLVIIVLLGGMAWNLLYPRQVLPPQIASSTSASAPVAVSSPPAPATNNQPVPPAPSTQGDVAKLPPAPATTPQKDTAAPTLAVIVPEKGEIKGMEPSAAPVPLILLRLHGSNTIGSRLAENLVSSYLAAKFSGKDIKVVHGASTEEKVVTARTPNGLIGIEIFAHGSSTGFKDLKAGSCDIGMASRRIKNKEILALSAFGDMTAPSSEHILALDGIAVIINKRNPIRSLTIKQIASIFSGTVTDWKNLTDGKFAGHINVYSRDNKSGTYDTFKGIVLKKTPLITTARRFESNAELSDDVSRDLLGIGFTGLPFIRQSKAISVSDLGTTPIYPNFFTVATEDYLLARRLYLYIPQDNENPIATDFIDYSLTTPGQVVVNETGFVDLGIRSFVASIDTDDQTIQNRVIFENYMEETRNKKRLSLNFRFRANSTELDNRALRDLDRMVEFLKDRPIESVSLIGFADSKGDYQYNTKLAMERSKVVRNELKSRGIPITSIISASEEMPVASNMTNKGREKNRRVEIWVGLDKA